jgi:hypothetical protein
LCCPNRGHKGTDNALRHVDIEEKHKLPNGLGAEQNDQEIEPAIPAVKRQPSRRMIKGVSKRVESHQIAVHVLPHFLGPMGAAGFDGAEG